MNKIKKYNQKTINENIKNEKHRYRNTEINQKETTTQNKYRNTRKINTYIQTESNTNKKYRQKTE